MYVEERSNSCHNRLLVQVQQLVSKVGAFFSAFARLQPSRWDAHEAVQSAANRSRHRGNGVRVSSERYCILNRLLEGALAAEQHSKDSGRDCVYSRDTCAKFIRYLCSWWGSHSKEFFHGIQPAREWRQCSVCCYLSSDVPTQQAPQDEIIFELLNLLQVVEEKINCTMSFYDQQHSLNWAQPWEKAHHFTLSDRKNVQEIENRRQAAGNGRLLSKNRLQSISTARRKY